jgi:Spy/CpxP family protein refolding chaperone
MNKNRFLKPLAVAAGFIFLCMAPGLTRAQSGQRGPAQTSNVVSSGAQSKKNSLPPDDFAGLTYSEEQKAEIDKIHQATNARKDAVVKDERLNGDQKDAMLQGYSRLEYVQVYKVLTPQQQIEVHQRVRARREAEQAAQSKQSPQK